MANPEESSPLLPKQSTTDDDEKQSNNPTTDPPPAPAAEEKQISPKKSPPPPPPQGAAGDTHGWTANGLPVGQGNVVGQPLHREQWDSGLCSCLGRNDEFFSSDLEVCLLGSVAPCVLYGSNVERLGSGPGTFANHCLTYSGLYFIGNTLFGWNCLAPWFSYPSRTALRQKFNLEGSCEALARSYGCSGIFMDDEVQREQLETSCDFATHIFCHACALCQEGREIRRRLPHPGFNAQPVLFMIPPGEQTMGLSGA